MPIVAFRLALLEIRTSPASMMKLPGSRPKGRAIRWTVDNVQPGTDGRRRLAASGLSLCLRPYELAARLRHGGALPII